MSSADLVKELTSNASLLVQRQVKLAKLEAKQELQKGKTMAVNFGVAGATAYAGLIMLFAAAALGIGAALNGMYWLGALIVAGALFIPAIVTGLIGWQKRIQQPLPRTRAELSKEITWAKYRTT
jgi:hypothetical protein